MDGQNYYYLSYEQDFDEDIAEVQEDFELSPDEEDEVDQYRYPWLLPLQDIAEVDEDQLSSSSDKNHKSHGDSMTLTAQHEQGEGRRNTRDKEEGLRTGPHQEEEGLRTSVINNPDRTEPKVYQSKVQIKLKNLSGNRPPPSVTAAPHNMAASDQLIDFFGGEDESGFFDSPVKLDKNGSSTYEVVVVGGSSGQGLLIDWDSNDGGELPDHNGFHTVPPQVNHSDLLWTDSESITVASDSVSPVIATPKAVDSVLSPAIITPSKAADSALSTAIITPSKAADKPLSPVITKPSKPVDSPLPPVLPEPSEPVYRPPPSPVNHQHSHSEDEAPVNTMETVIEREIRLAQEREEELRNARQLRTEEHKEDSPKEVEKVPVTPKVVVDHPVQVKAQTPVTPQWVPVTPKHDFSSQSYREMTEADRAGVSKLESIIEREIKEQMAREEEVKRLHPNTHTQETKEPEHDHVTLRDTSSAPADTLHSEPAVDLVENAAPPRQDLVLDIALSDTVVESPLVGEASEVMQGSNRSSRQGSIHGSDDGRQLKTYYDTVKKSGSPAESVIARELREQQEREAELRQRWRSMGFDVPAAADPPDTPYNRPEPKQPPELQTNSVQFNKHYNSTQKVLNTAMNYHQSDTPRPAASKPDPPRPVDDKVKVLPLTSAGDEDSNRSRFLPQTETPVEREIRLAREREALLRAERGLPMAAPPAQQDDMFDHVDDSTQPPRASMLGRGESVDERTKMKRLSASRLQMEVERERQREVDMRQKGHVSTVSEERVSATKYKDLIPEDATPPPLPLNRSTSQVTYPKLARPMMIVQEPANRTDDHSAVPDLANGVVSPNVSDDTGPKVDTHTDSPYTSMQVKNKWKPPVSESHSKTESLIEKELRELREREEELRQQRMAVQSQKEQ